MSLLFYFKGAPPNGPNGQEGNKDGGPPPGDYGEQTGAVKLENEFVMQYMGLSEMVRKMIGHDFDDFIKMCTFRGSTCLEST